MKRVGVFVDLSNLYYSLGNKTKNKKLDYSKYLEFVRDFGEIVILNAYGAQMDNQAESFIRRLKDLGFNTYYKNPKTYLNDMRIKRKADWDVGIALDVYDSIDQLDIIILGTADGDMIPLVERLIKMGKEVIILAAAISKGLKDIATLTIEIPESFLEKRHNGKLSSESILASPVSTS